MPVKPPSLQSRPPAQRYETRKNFRERGYTSRWDKEARRYRQEHPLCLGCEAVGEVAATELVDHMVPHRGSQTLMFDEANWQPSCRWHHDVVKQRLEVEWAAGRIGQADLRLDSRTAVEMTRLLRP